MAEQQLNAPAPNMIDRFCAGHGAAASAVALFQITWAELLERIKNPQRVAKLDADWFITCNATQRTKEACTQRGVTSGALVFEFDKNPPPLSALSTAVQSAFGDVEHAIYTTASATKSEPRCRLLIPTLATMNVHQRAACQHLMHELLLKHGFEPDASANDPAHVQFMPNDPPGRGADAIYEQLIHTGAGRADPLTLWAGDIAIYFPDATKAERATERVSDAFAAMRDPFWNLDKMQQALRQIDPSFSHLPKGKRRLPWRLIGFACYRQLGPEIGLRVWQAWSRGDLHDFTQPENYNPREMNTEWKAVEKEIDKGSDLGLSQMLALAPKEAIKDIRLGTASGSKDEVPDDVETPDSTIPFTTDYPPGLVGEIARYVHGASLTPIKSFSIGAGLFAMSLMTANRFYGGKMDTGLNLYTICCARTGVGKDATRKALKKLFAESGFRESVWEKAASATGLLRAMEGKKPPLFAMMSDEIGLVLQSYSGTKANPNDKALMALILQLFGSARGPFSGSAYARATDNIKPIDNPFFLLFGSTTPETLYPAFNMELVNAGTVNRIIVIGAAGIDPEPERLNFNVPEQLKEAIRNFERNAGLTPGGVGGIEAAVAARQANDVAVEFEPGAFEQLQSLVEMNDTEAQPEALWGRYREQIIRVATLVAIGDGGTITKGHVIWAHQWIDWCIRSFNRLLLPTLNESDFSKKTQKALEIIRHANKYSATDNRWGHLCKKGKMPLAKLKKVMDLPKKDSDQIIGFLHETYQVGLGKTGDISMIWISE